MKKVMISQPFRNRTPEQIEKAREDFRNYAKKEGLEIVTANVFTEEFSPESMQARGVRHVPLCYMSEAIKTMSLCDVVYFAEGWEDVPGCVLEHEIAKAYGLATVYAK